MLVQGPTSILISNYHHLTKTYNFLSPFFNIFQRKINIFEDFNHHEMVVFWPPFSAISSHIANFINYIGKTCYAVKSIEKNQQLIKKNFTWARAQVCQGHPTPMLCCKNFATICSRKRHRLIETPRLMMCLHCTSLADYCKFDTDFYLKT